MYISRPTKEVVNHALLGMLAANAVKNQISKEYGITGLQISLLLIIHHYQSHGLPITSNKLGKTKVANLRNIQYDVKFLIEQDFVHRYRLGKKVGYKLGLTDKGAAVVQKVNIFMTRKLNEFYG